MRRLLLLALAVPGASGCGTVMNLERAEPKVFGGTRMGVGDFSGGHQFGGIVGGPVCIADKPLSLVGDCVTLPYLLWKQGRAAFRPEQGTERLAAGSDTPQVYVGARDGTIPVIPGVIGRPVPEAERAAEAAGYLFVWRDGPGGYPMCAAQFQRVEVQVKDGVVTSARAFPGKHWP